MRMLDNIRIRKLENGYTVKYHIAVNEHSTGSDVAGQSIERFLDTKAAVASFLQTLVQDHLA